ncbi:rod shape-determining protein MreC [Campylobacter sp. FMV-PI01]|uniref:Rod shape-determining protein MreC n=1 Tax=Campylobacter portucalensis TaxID=2608384 RepID=A0A6L5WI36_9BACT|nr:rod shape-determining protein MreC [Campylobacter portucalensis]MSN95675.1 rod shape-determining protein MreC [Campylobacter portucalensis]
MNKIKKVVFLIIFVLLSVCIGAFVKGGVIDFSSSIIGFFKDTKNFAINKIDEHFNQVNTIKTLRAENLELKKSALLLNTFAHELNQILIDSKLTKYAPDVKLIKTLSYVSPGDYSKFWVDFDEFNKDKIYGVIFGGNSAGIITQKNNRPILILQHDPKSSFGVYVGDNKIPGIATGDGKRVVVKFIPEWLKPKIGDKVFTSGLDGVFFSGVFVGEVIEVIDEDLYKSVILKSNFNEKIPSYVYVITKEK